MKTKPFNPVEYLENDSEIQEYLHEAFLDDDPKVFVIAKTHIMDKLDQIDIASHEFTGDELGALLLESVRQAKAEQGITR